MRFLNNISEEIKKDGMVKDMYEGSASLGYIVATFQLIMSCVIGLLIFVAGIYVAGQPNPPPNKRINDGKKKLSNLTTGIIMMIFAAIIVAYAVFYYYIVYTYKAAAAAAGIDGVFDMIN